MATTTYISAITALDLPLKNTRGPQSGDVFIEKQNELKKTDVQQPLPMSSKAALPNASRALSRSVSTAAQKAIHVKETTEQGVGAPSTTDEQLVERVQKGDKRAFDLLVLKHQHKVMHLISRYIKDSSEVQDVAQEAFIRAYNALEDFRGDSQFYTWLYRIAVNTAKNWLVAKKRRPPGQDIDSTEADFREGATGLHSIATPEAELSSAQLETVINQTIEALPDDLKEALTLREYEGLGYDDIAQIMDCPVGTVRSRIFRAREALDKVIAPFLQNDSHRQG